jgi:4-hydroxybenzoate polyprenyltransferase|tara:strand:+ start:1713 stop:2585 length:873 start_codon:yes stop_codon:yes gene_type:complete
MCKKNKIIALIKLIRLDKPIGTLLLLWPTLWALWIASDGWPGITPLLIFTLGTFLMRSAGCIVNDFADRNVDGFVERTASRPLVTGTVSNKEAFGLFLILIFLSFLLVLQTNLLTIELSIFALVLASIYPFLKRYTNLPQLGLGIAFSWGIPMAFAAQTASVPIETWVLLLANLFWVVVYDTQYAMVDREDDLQIGIKSTAILFGEADRHIIGLLQLVCLLCLFWVAHEFSLGLVYISSIFLVAILFLYHLYLVRHRRRQDCFKAFKHNNWVGICILLGIIFDYGYRHSL